MRATIAIQGKTRRKRPALRCERCSRLRKKHKRLCKHCRDLKHPSPPKRVYRYACRDCGHKVAMDRHITTNKCGRDRCQSCGSTFLVACGTPKDFFGDYAAAVGI